MCKVRTHPLQSTQTTKRRDPQKKDSLTERGLVECCFASTETVGLLGTGVQDSHLDFHTAAELCHWKSGWSYFWSPKLTDRPVELCRFWPVSWSTGEAGYLCFLVSSILLSAGRRWISRQEPALSTSLLATSWSMGREAAQSWGLSVNLFMMSGCLERKQGLWKDRIDPAVYYSVGEFSETMAAWRRLVCSLTDYLLLDKLLIDWRIICCLTNYLLTD